MCTNMGGRGARNVPDVFEVDAPKKTIEAIYRESRPGSASYYKDEVLEAIAGENGELRFVYATPSTREKRAETNRTQYLTYELEHGAHNGDVFGVNWDKITQISGQTYNLRDEIKKHGFKWDGATRTWKKKG